MVVSSSYTYLQLICWVVMPRKQLWHFEPGPNNDCIYVKHGDSLLSKYGCVVKIKVSKEEKGDNYIKASCFIHCSDSVDTLLFSPKHLGYVCWQ